MPHTLAADSRLFLARPEMAAKITAWREHLDMCHRTWLSWAKAQGAETVMLQGLSFAGLHFARKPGATRVVLPPGWRSASRGCAVPRKDATALRAEIDALPAVSREDLSRILWGPNPPDVLFRSGAVRFGYWSWGLHCIGSEVIVEARGVDEADVPPCPAGCTPLLRSQFWAMVEANEALATAPAESISESIAPPSIAPPSLAPSRVL